MIKRIGMYLAVAVMMPFVPIVWLIQEVMER